MTKTASASPLRIDLSGVEPAFRAILVVLARLISGATLVIVAGLVAIAAAIIGALLAIAAVAMRFSKKRSNDKNASTMDSVTTLEARRTPRGWTVE